MKKYLLYTAACLLAFTSCDLNINDNPNYPSSGAVTAELIFPAAENAVADVVGDQMFNYGGFFAQYFEQRPEANQYNILAELHLDESSNLFDRCYSLIYAGALQDLNEIMSRDGVNASDKFACTVLRAYALALVVDNLDKAPYTEALKGNANTTPVWEDGQLVYNGILKEMDDAEAALADDDMTLTDPMLNKSVAQWKGFANALRLRLLLRLIDGGVDAAANEAKVKALVAADEFFTGDVAWNVYSDAEGQQNPWYDSRRQLGAVNHVAAYPIVSYMTQTGDPRIAYCMEPNAADGIYVGQIPGAKTKMLDWTGEEWKNKHVSTIKYDSAKSMPVYLFTQSELQFLIAEVQMRFNKNAAAAKEAYEKGVKNDFSSKGVAGVDEFLAGNTVNWDKAADKLALIYKQKWAALFMRDHMEAWSEIRRTDVPATSAASAEAIFNDPTKYAAGDMIVPAVNYIQAGGLAKRVPYPATARQLNRNTPEAKLLSDRVFWDVK